jgi:hypothetical protein
VRKLVVVVIIIIIIFVIIIPIAQSHGHRVAVRPPCGAERQRVAPPRAVIIIIILLMTSSSPSPPPIRLQLRLSGDYNSEDYNSTHLRVFLTNDDYYALQLAADMASDRDNTWLRVDPNVARAINRVSGCTSRALSTDLARYPSSKPIVMNRERSLVASLHP